MKMQQVYTGVFDILAMTMEHPVVKQADKGQQTSEFQKLMEQRQESEKPSAGSAPKAEQKEQPEAPKAESKSEQEQPQTEEVSETQLSWAALAVMQPQAEAVEIEEAVQPVQEAAQLAAPVQEAAPGQAAVDTGNGQLMQYEQPQSQPQAEQQAVQTPAAEQPQTAAPQAEAPVETAQAAGPQTAEANAARPAAEREAPVEVVTVQDDGAQTEEAAADMAQPLFRDVESAPIKVAEAPPAEQAETAQPVEKQVATRLEQALQNGESRVEIRLEPESLGSVTVELTRSSDGSLQVVLSAERASTRGLLEKNALGLQSLLASHGQDAVQVEIRDTQESQQQEYYDGRDGNDQSERRQQEQRQKRDSQNSEDFLQQLRLGLIPLQA